MGCYKAKALRAKHTHTHTPKKKNCEYHGKIQWHICLQMTIGLHVYHNHIYFFHYDLLRSLVFIGSNNGDNC